MSLHMVHSDLQEAFQRLRQRWEEAKTLWNDPVRWDFEKRHWQLLERETQATLKEMDRLAQTIVRARRNVE